MKSDLFVYHLVPKNLEGDILYPLNHLKKIKPTIAELHAKKYKGREELMEQRIPPLDCLWNDVLQFSPIHPSDIFQTFRDEGYDLRTTRWFEVPLDRLDMSKMAVYFHAKLRKLGDFSMPSDDFALLADVEFEPLTKLTGRLRKHIQMAKADNRKPLMLVGEPHIMYKGTLPLEGIKIIEV